MGKKRIQPEYPLAAICAVDWAMYQDQNPEEDDFDLLPVWIVGMVIKEDKKKVVLAHQHFFETKEVRYTTVISKSTILERIDYPAKSNPSKKTK